MNTFTILAEPSRRLLLDALLLGPAPVNALVDASGLSQPVVSKHLKIMRDAGIVKVEPQGQRRVYSIDPAPLADLDAWLMPYRRFWSEKLDALEQRLNDS